MSSMLLSKSIVLFALLSLAIISFINAADITASHVNQPLKVINPQIISTTSPKPPIAIDAASLKLRALRNYLFTANTDDEENSALCSLDHDDSAGASYSTPCDNSKLLKDLLGYGGDDDETNESDEDIALHQDDCEQCTNDLRKALKRTHSNLPNGQNLGTLALEAETTRRCHRQLFILSSCRACEERKLREIGYRNQID